MILQGYRHVRCGKQRGALVLADMDIESIARHLGIAGHVGQITVDLGDAEHGLASLAALVQQWQQIEGDVRVAAQAEMLGLRGVDGDQLGDQIQALGIEVAGDMAVVAADVVLLRRLAFEQTAGLEEELLDAHVARQLAAVQIGEKIQLGIIAVDPVDERFEKAPLQVLSGTRTRQAQRGVDGQLPLGHLPHPCIQRVDPAIGLAQTER